VSFATPCAGGRSSPRQKRNSADQNQDLMLHVFSLN
jgi:hypothetical protein